MGLLFEQLNDLRGYNVRLRKALGEEISVADSTLLASRPHGDPVRPGANEPAGPVERGVSQAGEPAAGEQTGTKAPATIFVVGERTQDGDKNFPLTVPTEGFVTREFIAAEFHYGIDFAAKEGTPVIAAAPGHVIFAGWTTGEGNMMMISHADGFVTVYKHNKSLLKSVGDAVRRGELVAQVGNTGRSTAPHLHFEVWRDGIAQNAANYLLTTQ